MEWTNPMDGLYVLRGDPLAPYAMISKGADRWWWWCVFAGDATALKFERTLKSLIDLKIDLERRLEARNV